MQLLNKLIFKKRKNKAGMVVYTLNASTKEAEAGRFLGFQASLVYRDGSSQGHRERTLS